MSDKTGPTATAATLRKSAIELYNDLSEELVAALKILRDGGKDLEAKSRAETIKAHRKALQTIHEIELHIFGKPKQDGEVHEINLETARSEIFSRLTRIARTT